MGEALKRTLTGMDPATEIAVRVTRFWGLVQKDDPDKCWLWSGYTEKGYGRFKWEGRMRFAHDLALMFATGERRIDGMDTCHSCDVPLCVNPRHLRYDTKASNVADQVERGRIPTGADRKNTKISDDVVVEMRTRAANGAPATALAHDYGLCLSHVVAIIGGRKRLNAGGPIAAIQRKSGKAS